jgi:asparagine synthase (glutamine-hydrolysing)
MLRDQTAYLPDDILTKVDRASMSVSLESRAPLLDHRVVEFAWRLPIGLKARNGKGKWLLRQVLYRHVPAGLVERPKMGFCVPTESWLRGSLRGWAEDLLDPGLLQRQGFLEPAVVREKWDAHQDGHRNWADDLWSVLMFQSWLAAQ